MRWVMAAWVMGALGAVLLFIGASVRGDANASFSAQGVAHLALFVSAAAGFIGQATCTAWALRKARCGVERVLVELAEGGGAVVVPGYDYSSGCLLSVRGGGGGRFQWFPVVKALRRGTRFDRGNTSFLAETFLTDEDHQLVNFSSSLESRLCFFSSIR